MAATAAAASASMAAAVSNMAQTPRTRGISLRARATAPLMTARSFNSASISTSRSARSTSRRHVMCSAEPTEAETIEEETVTPKSLDVNQVMKLLPHRYPFLLVDKVKEVVAGEYAIGIKSVTMNEEFFQGHFPGRPIMPGVLIVEALAQTGGIAILGDDEENKQLFFFGGIEKCRFRKPVVPGDQLELRVNVVSLRKRFGVAKLHGEAYVDGELVCDCDMTMALGG